jgi:hypothetical protein
VLERWSCSRGTDVFVLGVGYRLLKPLAGCWEDELDGLSIEGRVFVFVNSLRAVVGRFRWSWSPFCSPFIETEDPLTSDGIDDDGPTCLLVASRSIDRPVLLCCSASAEVIIQGSIQGNMDRRDSEFGKDCPFGS